jgi:hypothetical protein
MIYCSQGQDTSPLLNEELAPDTNGIFDIQFTLSNSSETTAEGLDVWVYLCEVCSFAHEPAGMDRPAGTSTRSRHFTFSSLNPGVSMNVQKIEVKLAPQTPATQSFAFGVRYSCRTCGGKVSPLQKATITIQPDPRVRKREQLTFRTPPRRRASSQRPRRDL